MCQPMPTDVTMDLNHFITILLLLFLYLIAKLTHYENVKYWNILS
jgi:hypothetical protein